MPAPRLRLFGATGEVTGSCHLLEFGRHRVLLDCGMVQGSREDEERNAQPFPFDPARLDAVVLSHAHIDHSGRLPLLVKRGFSGPIYTQRASRDLCRIMLRDAAFLSEKDAALDTRKRARMGLPPVAPLYGQDDVDACMLQFQGMDYDATREILPGLTLNFHDAGHILGAAIVELRIGEGRARRRLVFSGDIGQGVSPLMPPPARIAEADLVLMESTYGDRQHRPWKDTLAELGQVLKAARECCGNVLVPAFTVGRTQELLHLMALHHKAWRLDRWNVFVDSPMAISASKVYQKHWRLLAPAAGRQVQSGGFHLPRLHWSQTEAQSMAINRMQSGAIIIAGSGMCSGGRIRHHLKHHLWRPESHVVIIGFQAQGTLGRRLVDGAETVRLWGEPVRVAAQIHTINGLSAHADQQGLLDWYGGFAGRPPVALVHGEDMPRRALAAELAARYGVHAQLPRYGESLSLG